MKNSNYFLLLGMILCMGLSFTACEDEEPVPTPEPDPCATVTCENGGTCNDGLCDCPPGFSGDNCEIEDPCHQANINQEWGYDDFGGPSCWNQVCSGHDNCTGLAQSPINITMADTVTTLPNLLINGSLTKTTIENNGHTLMFNMQPGNFATYGQTGNGLFNDFTLGQFHFHTTSEHQVDGTNATMEAHLVHRSIWGDHYLVLSVLFEEGASNTFLEKFVSNLPADIDGKYNDDALTYNPYEILPTNRSYYTYQGSLTTPPCSENVTWVIMQNKVEATAAQIKAFSDILGSNARPVQDLNNRPLNFVQL